MNTRKKDRTRTGPKPKPNKRAAQVNLGVIAELSKIKEENSGVITNDAKRTAFCNYWHNEVHKSLRLKGCLDDDDMSYLIDKMQAMKDERLKGIITNLIGWGDDERATIETFSAIALEVMKKAPSDVILQCANTVEFRYLVDIDRSDHGNPAIFTSDEK